MFCLPDGPRVLDCLDFDDRLRHIDVLDDACCLAMDLERLHAPQLATVDTTGPPDQVLEYAMQRLTPHLLAGWPRRPAFEPG